MPLHDLRHPHSCDPSLNPLTQELFYESLINIRPRQNNRLMEILDPGIRDQVAQFTKALFGGV